MDKKWTNEPPTESGWYWWRDNCDPGTRFTVLVVEDCVTSEPYYINGGLGDIENLGEFSDGADDLEWWPIPIEEPPD